MSLDQIPETGFNATTELFGYDVDDVVPASPLAAIETTPNRLRRKRDDDYSARPKKLAQRIILSVTKPSYLLGLGTKNVRTENRARLERLLHKLVRQHNWREASGVLSVLLKATCNNKLPEKSRDKYWIAMELLKFLDPAKSFSSMKIRDVYAIWMRKVGLMKDNTLEDRFRVQEEYILYCLQIGDLGEAHQAAIVYMQESQFGRDGTSLMVVGLTYYQMWYADIPKEMKLEHLERADNTSADMQSHMSISGGKFSYLHDNSNGSYAVDCESVDCPCDSETSVRVDKIMSEHATVDSVQEVSAEVDVHIEEEKLQPSFNQQSFYMNSADTENEEASFENYGDDLEHSVFTVPGGLDPWLLPIQLPHSDDNAHDHAYLRRVMINDDYKAAVKYFDLALQSSPPVLSALSPLVQLLMVGERVKQALSLVEKFCQNANTTLPFRLRARILERFDFNDRALISSCYEDLLKNDPTCRYSLEKLISMHRNEDFSPESLVEMISLHLDATFGEVSIWEEFAMCLLKLSKGDEDRMSICLDGNQRGVYESSSVHHNRIPQVFIQDVPSVKSWIFRCKWWLRRHFGEKMVLSEISSRNLSLLTYKAACACHLYGLSLEYVTKVRNFLEHEDRDMRMFLQTHMQNSVGFYSRFGPGP